MNKLPPQVQSGCITFSCFPPHLIAGFTQQPHDMGFGRHAPKAIVSNRRLILSKFGIDCVSLVCVEQTHSRTVYVAGGAERGRGALQRFDALPDADGLITKETQLPLAVFTADCVPIYCFDPHHNVIGLVHAGWRGTKVAIAKHMIAVMREVFGSRPAETVICFGPAIRACCYEIDAELCFYFGRAVVRKKRKAFLDLVGLNALQLQEAGVHSNHMFDTELCTCCCEDRFFSYRRQGARAGRHMAFMMLREDKS